MQDAEGSGDRIPNELFRDVRCGRVWGGAGRGRFHLCCTRVYRYTLLPTCIWLPQPSGLGADFNIPLQEDRQRSPETLRCLQPLLHVQATNHMKTPFPTGCACLSPSDTSHPQPGIPLSPWLASCPSPYTSQSDQGANEPSPLSSKADRAS